MSLTLPHPTGSPTLPNSPSPPCLSPVATLPSPRNWSQAWSCEWYYTSLIEPPDGSVTYSKNLLKDLRLECDSEEHREAIRIAVGSAILWPLGSLVLFAALLVPVRRPLLQQRPNSLSRATSFLHRE